MLRRRATSSCAVLAGGVLAAMAIGLAPSASADVLDDLAGQYSTGAGAGQVANLLSDALNLRAQGFAPKPADLEAVKAALAKRPNQAPLLSALQTTVAHQKKRQSQLGQSPEIGTPKAGTWTPMTPNQGDPIHDNYDRAIPMPGR